MYMYTHKYVYISIYLYIGRSDASPLSTFLHYKWYRAKFNKPPKYIYMYTYIHISTYMYVYIHISIYT
jgi:hypothetical protein